MGPLLVCHYANEFSVVHIRVNVTAKDPGKRLTKLKYQGTLHTAILANERKALY